MTQTLEEIIDKLRENNVERLPRKHFPDDPALYNVFKELEKARLALSYQRLSHLLGVAESKQLRPVRIAFTDDLLNKIMDENEIPIYEALISFSKHDYSQHSVERDNISIRGTAFSMRKKLSELVEEWLDSFDYQTKRVWLPPWQEKPVDPAKVDSIAAYIRDNLGPDENGRAFPTGVRLFEVQAALDKLKKDASFVAPYSTEIFDVLQPFHFTGVVDLYSTGGYDMVRTAAADWAERIPLEKDNLAYLSRELQTGIVQGGVRRDKFIAQIKVGDRAFDFWPGGALWKLGYSPRKIFESVVRVRGVDDKCEIDGLFFSERYTNEETAIHARQATRAIYRVCQSNFGWNVEDFLSKVEDKHFRDVTIIRRTKDGIVGYSPWEKLRKAHGSLLAKKSIRDLANHDPEFASHKGLRLPYLPRSSLVVQNKKKEDRNILYHFFDSLLANGWNPIHLVTKPLRIEIDSGEIAMHESGGLKIRVQPSYERLIVNKNLPCIVIDYLHDRFGNRYEMIKPGHFLEAPKGHWKTWEGREHCRSIYAEKYSKVASHLGLANAVSCYSLSSLRGVDHITETSSGDIRKKFAEALTLAYTSIKEARLDAIMYLVGYEQFYELSKKDIERINGKDLVGLLDTYISKMLAEASEMYFDSKLVESKRFKTISSKVLDHENIVTTRRIAAVGVGEYLQNHQDDDPSSILEYEVKAQPARKEYSISLGAIARIAYDNDPYFMILDCVMAPEERGGLGLGKIYTPKKLADTIRPLEQAT